MTRGIYPIQNVIAGDNQRFPMSCAELFEAEGASREDEFTYTARLEVTDTATRDRIRARLRTDEPDDAERLIALFDANDWSISILVDNY
jgi:hypothetical protein